MKSGLFAVMRKELARFFGDKRMVASILLPGILIYFVYSFMGQAMGSMFGVDEDFAPAAQVVELPDSLAEPLQSAGLTLTEVEADQEEAAREAITGQELDLLLVFPADFDQAVADYAPASGQPAPQVAVYYNSSSTQSQFAYTAVTELLDTYEAQLANKFDVNAGAERYDLTTEEDAAGAYFAMLLPMLLMIFLYSGCAAVAPESIAGEKERGTIATMLITPIPQAHIGVQGQIERPVEPPPLQPFPVIGSDLREAVAPPQGRVLHPGGGELEVRVSEYRPVAVDDGQDLQGLPVQQHISRPDVQVEQMGRPHLVQQLPAPAEGGQDRPGLSRRQTAKCLQAPDDVLHLEEEGAAPGVEAPALQDPGDKAEALPGHLVEAAEIGAQLEAEVMPPLLRHLRVHHGHRGAIPGNHEVPVHRGP